MVPEANTSSSHGDAMYLTIDGNHHANRYAKNSDPHDESLLKGQSYFPEKKAYRDYLAKTMITKEVSFTYFSWLILLKEI